MKKLDFMTLPEDPTDMIDEIAKVNLKDEKLDDLIKLTQTLAAR